MANIGAEIVEILNSIFIAQLNQLLNRQQKSEPLRLSWTLMELKRF